MLNVYTLQQVGTDAEVFLKDKLTGKPVPVVGRLGGTKMAPIPVENLGEGFAVQEDNVMAEFNVPPSYTPEMFSVNIGRMLAHIRKVMYEQDLIVDIESSKHFTIEDLLSPQAQTFGCDPDLCAWTGEFNEINLGNPLLETMRTAAAHIHTSYLVNGMPPKTVNERLLAVKAHDLFIGVPSILLANEQERRQIYGKAGAFRITNYGHEYRTVGNFWIAQDETRQWIHKQTRKALGFISTQDGVDTLMKNQETIESIQSCINANDVAIADWLCSKYSIELPAD